MMFNYFKIMSLSQETLEYIINFLLVFWFAKIFVILNNKLRDT